MIGSIVPMEKNVEKQISQLRQQVYGKASAALYTLPANTPNADMTSTQMQTNSDITYLKKDLLKIFILTALALASEFGLYYALQNNLVKLPI